MGVGFRPGEGVSIFSKTHMTSIWNEKEKEAYVDKGGGEGGDTHRLTFPLVISPPP